MKRDLWVDFNDVDKNGYTSTLRRHVESDVLPTIGGHVLVGDDDGNLCKAVITALDDESITLALDLGSFQGAKYPPKQLVAMITGD